MAATSARIIRNVAEEGHFRDLPDRPLVSWHDNFAGCCMSLDEIIIERIRCEGPLSFHDFMEMALYYPGLGYYTSEREKIGRDGDYLTSPAISSLFGSLVARQLEEMWEQIAEEEFTIVEYGPGNGKLCYDILNALSHHRNMNGSIRYYLIEPSKPLPDLQTNALPNNVHSIKSVDELGAFNGCVLSNEVPDNFPVHRVVMQDELMEVFVGFDEKFVEVLQPASDLLKAYFEEMDIQLPYGFQTEINLDMLSWLGQISRGLQKGFLITIDYGDISGNLYRSSRSDGTLLCYYRHRRSSDFYQHIGEQDITAHLNFSALSYWGEQLGMSSIGLTTQSQFLLSLGLIDRLRELEQCNVRSINTNQQYFLIRDFLLQMGSQIKVLIQHKGIHRPILRGMQFARKVA